MDNKQNCGCIKGNYDFALSSITNKALLYQDLSIWMDDEGYTTPAKYPVTITTPAKMEFVVDVFTNSLTRISPEMLGATSNGCFIDGIYCFTVDNCGTTFKRNRAYIPNLECCLQNLIAKAQTDEDFNVAKEIEFYVKSIHINSELNKPVKANQFFKIAERKMKQLNCECYP